MLLKNEKVLKIKAEGEAKMQLEEKLRQLKQGRESNNEETIN